ncbi:hypothetical protein AAMO2058_000704100 [Amorphochlora amoebiformis]
MVDSEVEMGNRTNQQAQSSTRDLNPQMSTEYTRLDEKSPIGRQYYLANESPNVMTFSLLSRDPAPSDIKCRPNASSSRYALVVVYHKCPRSILIQKHIDEHESLLKVRRKKPPLLKHLRMRSVGISDILAALQD